MGIPGPLHRPASEPSLVEVPNQNPGAERPGTAPNSPARGGVSPAVQRKAANTMGAAPRPPGEPPTVLVLTTLEISNKYCCSITLHIVQYSNTKKFSLYFNIIQCNNNNNNNNNASSMLLSFSTDDSPDLFRVDLTNTCLADFTTYSGFKCGKLKCSHYSLF